MCSPTIRNYAALFREARNGNRIEALHETTLAIADDVADTKGETHVQTSADEALEQGSGVCQDHAHIFVRHRPHARHSGALCQRRSLSMRPPRPPRQPRRADAFVEHLGRVSFHPSTRTGATEAYTRIATALDDLRPARYEAYAAAAGLEP